MMNGVHDYHDWRTKSELQDYDKLSARSEKVFQETRIAVHHSAGTATNCALQAFQEIRSSAHQLGSNTLRWSWRR
jgi:hypothetical protein